MMSFPSAGEQHFQPNSWKFFWGFLKPHFIVPNAQNYLDLIVRIWEQIINKSVDNLKKTEIELLIEEQRAQKEKLANIESTLKAIEISLGNMK